MHTKGPWKVENGSVYTHDQKRIALMDREEPQTSPIERDTNAQLIASAPDMLEVLEAVLAMVDNGAAQNISGDSIARVVRKAKGES